MGLDVENIMLAFNKSLYSLKRKQMQKSDKVINCTANFFLLIKISLLDIFLNIQFFWLFINNNCDYR